jgi:hypothetical protein
MAAFGVWGATHVVNARINRLARRDIGIGIIMRASLAWRRIKIMKIIILGFSCVIRFKVWLRYKSTERGWRLSGFDALV